MCTRVGVWLKSALPALAVTLLIVSCQAATSPSAPTSTTLVEPSAATPPAEKIELVFINGDPSPPTVEVFQQIFDRYNEQSPNVSVKLVTPSDVELGDVVRAGLVGEAPITFFEGDLPSGIRDPWEGGLLAPWTEYYDQYGWREKFAPWQVELASWEGDIWAVPLELGMAPVPVYSVKVFSDVGVEPPETWEDFLAVCDTLKTAGISPIVVGARDLWPALHWVNLTIMNRLGPERYAELGSGKLSFEDPEVVEAVRLIGDLVEQGCFAEESAGLSNDEAAAAFASGRAGMWMGGFWAYRSLRDFADLEWSWFPLPLPPGQDLDSRMFWAHTPGLGLVENEPNKDAAAAFIDFFLEVDNQRLIFSETGIPHAVLGSVRPEDAPHPALAEESKALAEATNVSTGLPALMTGEVGDALGPASGALIGREISVDQWIEQVEAARVSAYGQ